jgi:hypothetical protein
MVDGRSGQHDRTIKTRRWRTARRGPRNEQKALSLWIKGPTFRQIAAAGFGIASASGAWRSVHRAVNSIRLAVILAEPRNNWLASMIFATGWKTGVGARNRHPPSPLAASGVGWLAFGPARRGSEQAR